MAGNQNLSYHRVSERIYDLTGLRTGSVRDQMLRAILLVDGLVSDSKEISDKYGEGLLVLGGGVAGVSCALAAAQLNVRVTLIEEQLKVFSTLLLVDWRRIDPYEYDWPHPVPQRRNFPKRSSFPLQYDGGTAASVARSWEAAFDAWMLRRNPAFGSPGHLEFLRQTDARNFKYRLAKFKHQSKTSKRVLASGLWPGGNGPSKRTYGALVVCAGFGRERTFDPNRNYPFVGPGFWTENDMLDKQDFALTHPPRVLISGGGDGAMQDLQRAASGKFGKELFDELEAALGFGARLSGYFLPLALADDRAKRAYAWKGEKGLSSKLIQEMREWHRTYVKVVDDIIQDYAKLCGTTVSNAVNDLANRLLKPAIIADPRAEVTWIVKDQHPNYAYALNRFLSIFVVHLLESVRPGTDIFRTETEVVNITAVNPSLHSCGNPLTCHGVPHKVTLSERSFILEPEEFDVIILRHGLERLHLSGLPCGAPIPDQMVPYDIPS